MLDSIKRAVVALFPELGAGLHLDRYARVRAVADPPEDGAGCDRFRPRYAVDLEILTPEGERDEAFPLYEAVPLPVSVGAGLEAGLYGAPEPGALVVVGFAYGRPDCPLVRQIYPQGLSLPDLRRRQQRWQQSAAVYQDVDPDGDWRRVTDMAITDECAEHVVRADLAERELGAETRNVDGASVETVGGVKRIEAHGALRLLTAGSANLSAADTLSLTAAHDLRTAVADDARKVVGKDDSTTIKGDRTAQVGGDEQETVSGRKTVTVGGAVTVSAGADVTETVNGQSTESATGDKTITAAHIGLKAGTFTIVSKDGAVSFLPTVLAFMADTRAALAALADHTHPTPNGVSDVPDVQGEVSAHAANIGQERGDLESISR
ncbi:MAG: hypothetical protein PWQ57_2037 [Desulfovibrionales bacterium]|nr:hypothetical protein [Desulfovibrionales bacterium]